MALVVVGIPSKPDFRKKLRLKVVSMDKYSVADPYLGGVDKGGSPGDDDTQGDIIKNQSPSAHLCFGFQECL